MDQLPEWTPGPGEYILPTDFNQRHEKQIIPAENDLDQDIVEIIPRWDQKGNKFGHGGRDDLKRKDPGYPGAGLYKHKESFKYNPKSAAKKTIDKQPPTGKLAYPHAYDIRDVNNGIKTSFGMATLCASVKGRHGLASSQSELSGRSMPAHLRLQKYKTPGPGTYEAKNSVQTLKRDRKSMQDCTWQQKRGGFIDIPQGIPGPGTYQVENLEQVQNMNRVKAMESGYSFPQGPKDAMLTAVSKNKNPGPGSHNISALDKRKQGTTATMGQVQPPKPLPDNGVPGPGTYQVEHKESIPSFKIEKDIAQDEARRVSRTQAIGPNHYYPTRPHEGQPGTKIGNAERRDELTNANPAPSKYHIRGDFDFKDPNNVDDKNNKVPKFAFGIKPVIKNPNQDVPGPGSYEIDQPNMSHQGIAYWIGTDVRRDLGVPYAKDFPGPGSYDHGQQMHPGAYISFPVEKKKTSIVKTNDPGPASYHIHNTVGVIPFYNRFETHPREENQAAKQA